MRGCRFLFLHCGSDTGPNSVDCPKVDMLHLPSCFVERLSFMSVFYPFASVGKEELPRTCWWNWASLVSRREATEFTTWGVVITRWGMLSPGGSAQRKVPRWQEVSSLEKNVDSAARTWCRVPEAHQT